MKIGYIRISTTDQNAARQEVMMQELGVEQVYIDMVASEKWCDTADDVLEYMVSGDRLGDLITQVTAWDRTI